MYFRYAIHALLAAVLTIGSATLHGHLVGRWTSQSELACRGQQLSDLPAQIGPWQLVSEQPLPASSVEMLQCSASQHRVYRHAEQGTEVDLMVILGPPGPTSVHTPEICYPSQNFKPTSGRQKFSMTSKLAEGTTTGTAREDASQDHQFWMVTFESNDIHARSMRVFYAWNAGTQWEAPEQPRFHFAGSPWLYKLQLSVSGAPPHAALAERFLEALVPVLQQRLTVSDPPDTHTTT